MFKQKGNRSQILSKGDKTGSALILVLWIILILSLIVGSFAFEMQLEARLISMKRKQFKAQQLSFAGIELAKAMLSFEDIENNIIDDEMLNAISAIQKGLPQTYSEKIGDGEIELKIDFEEGKRNILLLMEEKWYDFFEYAAVPNDKWESLIDCMTDWQDVDELKQLNGAESNDEFYENAGYKCKNAPINTLDEFLLIKGWSEEILYGPQTDKDSAEDNENRGIASYITVWADNGLVNPNSASREVLKSTGLNGDRVEAVIQARCGPDGIAGTPDDGITQNVFEALGLDEELFTLTPEYASITSSGKIGDWEVKTSAVFKLNSGDISCVSWHEGIE